MIFQIVPSGKFHVTELSTLGITSPEREEQLRQDWSLENMEGFVSQERNVKSFLRESWDGIWSSSSTYS